MDYDKAQYIRMHSGGINPEKKRNQTETLLFKCIPFHAMFHAMFHGKNLLNSLKNHDEETQFCSAQVTYSSTGDSFPV